MFGSSLTVVCHVWGDFSTRLLIVSEGNECKNTSERLGVSKRIVYESRIRKEKHLPRSCVFCPI